jgi:predicted alpha/beta-fold hydrolase
MPILHSRFRPPSLLGNGHAQTILPVVLPRRITLPFTRTRLELSDGDFLDLDWVRNRHARLAIIAHGLEGSSAQKYVRGMAGTLHAAQWDVLAWNFRGCSGEPNRLLRAYHSGDTADLAAVIAHAAADYERIALIGFSLGGNVVLKYLGEAPPQPAVFAAVAISAPLDLTSSARALDQRPDNRIYLRRFLEPLIAKIEAKALKFRGELDIKGVGAIRSFQEFDDRFTAPLHGFRDAADYWARSSARQFLPGISLPTLILNARTDPFLTIDSIPESEASAHSSLFLEAPESGGHVGFLDFTRGVQPWSERRVAEFLSE